jgi:hypothetical protein
MEHNESTLVNGEATENDKATLLQTQKHQPRSHGMKIISQLCTRIRCDLELLLELLDDANDMLRSIDNNCITLLDSTARKMRRDEVLGLRHLRRQNGVDESEDVVY